MSDLKQVVEQLKLNNNETKKLRGSIDSFVEDQKRSALDNLEREKREKSKQETLLSLFKDKKGNSSFGRNFGFFGNLAGLIKPLTLGVAAIGAAFLGLRGWETKTLKVLNSIKNLTPTLLIKPFFSLRNRVLKMFGLGVDGKPIVIRGKDGKFKTPVFQTLAKSVSKFFKPIISFSSGITNWMRGPGNALMTALRPFTSFAGGFSRLFTKIMWPIGVLVSSFKAITKFTSTEGTLWERIVASLGVFVGDFIGAPLNLLRDLLSWTLGKFGFDETAKAIKDFDFVGKIEGLITGILNFPAKAITWIQNNFKFDEGIVNGLWNGVLATLKLSADIFMIPVDMAKSAVSWLVGKFKWESPVLANAMDSVTPWVDSLKGWLEPRFDWIAPVLNDPMGTVASWAFDAGQWIGVKFAWLKSWAEDKFKWDETKTPVVNIWENLTSWGESLAQWVVDILPDLSKIADNFSKKLYSLMPDWAKSAIDKITEPSMPNDPPPSVNLSNLPSLAIDNTHAAHLEGVAIRNQLIAQQNSDNARAILAKELENSTGKFNLGAGHPVIVFTGNIDQSSNSSGTVVHTTPVLGSENQSTVKYAN